MTNRHDLEVELRQAEAMKMRLAGHQYDAIAKKLGYASKSGAYAAVMAALDATRRPAAEQLRTLQLERLERLLFKHWPAAMRGDHRATEQVLKIMARMDRLNGIDVPPLEDIAPYIRQMAEAEGFDGDQAEQAVRDAERLIKLARLDHQG